MRVLSTGFFPYYFGVGSPHPAPSFSFAQIFELMKATPTSVTIPLPDIYVVESCDASFLFLRLTVPFPHSR